uniref:PITH domain-containing protein n=1 Tax=Meloidogyne javanica TaxID=6303 RepID=A0A915MD58_MELJA
MLKPIKWLPSSCQTRRCTANVSLVKCIDLLVLNALIEFQKLLKLLKRKDFVHTDVDEQLLFSVPFTANVKLTRVTFSGPLSGSFASTVRLFKDRGNVIILFCINKRFFVSLFEFYK